MIDDCIKRYPQLKICQDEMLLAVASLISSFEKGGKLLICGNGGSCSDAEHISGELLKGFLKKRPLPVKKREEMSARCPQAVDLLKFLQEGLPAIPLPSLISLNSAYSNDVDPSMIYAQGVLSLGKPGDSFLGISTSGNSQNVYKAAIIAKSLGISVISLTGESGGRLKNISEICIRVPETETYKVQELHLPVYHVICALIEEHFFCK